MKKLLTLIKAKSSFFYGVIISITTVIAYANLQTGNFHRVNFFSAPFVFSARTFSIFSKLKSRNMKKLFLMLCLLASTFYSVAQIKGIFDRAKQKAGNKASEKVDKTIDKTTEPSSGKTEKPPTEAEKKGTEHNDASTPARPSTDSVRKEPASIKAYSKFDFVPGEKVVGFEDYSTGAVGDFPAGWNTNASAEIVTVEGMPGRWLWLTKPGVFIPEFAGPLPEDFTFEFDLLHGTPINGAYFTLCIAEISDVSNMNQLQGWSVATNQFNVSFDNANTGSKSDVSRFFARKNSVTDIQNSSSPGVLNDHNNPAHISIWRQKERVRVYVNEVKIWDVPKAAKKDTKFNAIIFTVTYAEEVVKHYIGNLRLAVGAPDTRKKILEQNKWVTHGILFDVNSANIKPESYGTLKEMANVLKEYADLKVKIVGHTDADGKDADNLDLSRRRASSVKIALAKEFGIDEKRMETDGKGEGEPIDKNNTPAAKANNRRVEFIKL